eukprot:TRINITY_DN94224_c0_g1_i1.p1 TRINITY_DN94224_c0_g1~~TRINITY_DN94224_c0_g1_i1.p1  ORF type:complete len:353 (+),score=65.52 TRINITY_DN94224_c0_g1_i1:170-1228(+)
MMRILQSVVSVLVLVGQGSEAFRLGDAESLSQDLPAINVTALTSLPDDNVSVASLLQTDGEAKKGKFIFLVPLAYAASHASGAGEAIAVGAEHLGVVATHTAAANAHAAILAASDAGLAAFHGHLGTILSSCKEIWLHGIASEGSKLLSDCENDFKKANTPTGKEIAKFAKEEVKTQMAARKSIPTGHDTSPASSSPSQPISPGEQTADEGPSSSSSKKPTSKKQDVMYAKEAVTLVKTTEQLVKQVQKYRSQAQDLYKMLTESETATELVQEAKSKVNGLCSKALQSTIALTGVPDAVKWLCTCKVEANSDMLWHDGAQCKRAMPNPPEISEEAMKQAAEEGGLDPSSVVD